MKIHPSRFHDTPRPIQFETDAAQLCSYLRDAGEGYADAAKPAVFEGEGVAADPGIQVEGTLSLAYTLTCGRCTVQRTREAEVAVNWVLMPQEELTKDQLRPHELIELSTDDLDVSFYSDDEVDLNELVREAILLFLDPNSACGEEECDARLTELLKTQREADGDAPVDPRWADLAKLKSKLKN